jgi:hypothetical protein
MGTQDPSRFNDIPVPVSSHENLCHARKMKHALTWSRESCTTPAMSSAQLCNVPPEVLDQILDYAVPVRRLTGQRPRDPEWMEY